MQSPDTKDKETSYIVIVDYDLIKFTEKVNNKIKEGYSLKGGIAVTAVTAANWEIKNKYYQALFKKFFTV